MSRNKFPGCSFLKTTKWASLKRTCEERPQYCSMGKFKKPRIRNRPDPRGKPAKVLPDSRMLPVLKDLQSAELTKRSTAASLIANLIEDPVTRKALLREQIVRVLLEQTLCDSDLETRTVGWGILRNLALEEDASFCVHLYRQDVLTALEGVVKSVGYSNMKSFS